jgi:crossover junction endodeoxyribonuclease RuvC
MSDLLKKQIPAETLILGIDPGSRVTGYGVIRVLPRGYEAVDFGCIRPSTSKKASVRYKTIFEGVLELLDLYKPQALAIETQYVHKNILSAIKLGKAAGVIMVAASLREIPIFEYAPSKAKKAVVGNGQATKEQVQRMVKALLSLSKIPEPADAADALALAICHANALRFNIHTQHLI